MKSTNNTILITGGSAGIGFEMAKLLSAKGNKVIITGRNKERLYETASRLTNVTPLVSDITNEEEVNSLIKNISSNFPLLNMVINNAGNAFLYDLAIQTNIFEKAQDEMLTNYLSVIRLNEKLLPILKNQKESAIVNVSSVVAFVPGSLPTYSASKAALHSYTLSLRVALEDTPVKVFELMPPLVDTQFSKMIGGHRGIQPLAVAEELVKGLDSDTYEIHVGQTAAVYKLFLSSPEDALRQMLKQRKQQLLEAQN